MGLAGPEVGMAIGDIVAVDGDQVSDCWYVDTGLYGIEEYGSVYLLDGARPALVETGIGKHYEHILDLLEAADVAREDLQYIIPTHVHLDHAGGAGFLAEACPNATVAIHERGARHLADPGRLVAGTKAAVGDRWRHYVDPKPIADDRIRPLSDGDEIDLGDRTLEAIETPGHAPHHHSFYLPEDAAIFPADAAGLYVQATGAIKPTTPPPDFDYDQNLEDLDRLASVDPDVLLYSHFGPVADSSILTEYEEVLTEWVTMVEGIHADSPDAETTIERVLEQLSPVEVWGEEHSVGEAAMNVRGVLNYLDP